MEFSDVVRRRRMVRNYSPEPVEAAVLDRIVHTAVRAPSAGFSQGWGFLVLDEPETVARYWRATAGERVSRPGRWLRGMMTAPAVVVPFSHRDAYLDRYAEADKGWTDRDPTRWSVAYWDVDTGMAALLMLLAAVDEGLGACFFGVPAQAVSDLRAAFGVPVGFTPVGALTIGHRVGDVGSPGSASRGRRPLAEVVHRNRWAASGLGGPSC